MPEVLVSTALGKLSCAMFTPEHKLKGSQDGIKSCHHKLVCNHRSLVMYPLFITLLHFPHLTQM